jgi:hypothetical protein
MQKQTSKKILTTLIAAILLLPILSAAIPVYASTGHPKLGVVDDYSAPTTITIADLDISVPAGSMNVYAVDGTPATGYFAVVFYVDGWLVDFSGAQFDLYMSTNGYSQINISSGDKKYAQGFSVADLDASPLKKKGDFYIGTFTDSASVVYKVLVGPIMFDDVTPEYEYIKIYDGDKTSVAVGTQTVDVLPSLKLTPDYGPGGASVTLKGVALEPNKLLNLTYGNGASDEVFAQTWTDPVGKFTYPSEGSWNIKDLEREFESVTEQHIPSDSVYIYAWYNATGYAVAPYNLHRVTYTEYARAFWQFKSVKAGASIGPGSDKFHGWGNATATNYIVVDAYVFDTLVVAGLWWNPTGPVTFVTDGISWDSIKPNATGFFNITLKVPELSQGPHLVKVYNAGVRYEFKVNILPTLILLPEEGTIGTVVQVKVYGFPENALIGVWWEGYSWLNVVNGTTGPDGKFNVTVTFMVPHDYGGDHPVDGCYEWSDGVVAYAIFTVLPKLEVVPSDFKNDGSILKAVGTGFDPSYGYSAKIDNNEFSSVIYSLTGGFYANEIGDINIEFVAAGFRPGLHVFSLYPSWEGYEEIYGEFPPPTYSLAAYALFTVATEGDSVIDFLKSMNATLVEIRDGMGVIQTSQGELQVQLDDIDAKIVSLAGDVATISTTVGDLEVKLDDIDAKIVSLAGDVATINTAVGELEVKLDAIGLKVTSINGSIVTIETDLGTIQGYVKDVDNGGLATISTALGTVKTDVSTIKGYFPVTVDMTPVWIALALSLIAALSASYAAIMISRKIAG